MRRRFIGITIVKDAAKRTVHVLEAGAPGTMGLHGIRVECMKIGINKRKLGLQLVFLILLVPLVWFVVTPIIKPWAIRRAGRMIAEWEQLQDDGYALMKAGNYDDAEASFRAALSYAEERFIVQPSREGTSAFALGGVLLLQERFEEGRSHFERNLQIREEEDGKSSPALCTVLGRLVDVCIETGDFDAALDYAQRAVSIREAERLSADPELPPALRNLARVYEKQKQYAIALRIRARIVQLMEDQERVLARDLGIAYYREALIHNVLEDYGVAEELYQKGLAALRGSVEPEAECLVLLVREYARLLDATGRADEASRLRASKGLPTSP